MESCKGVAFYLPSLLVPYPIEACMRGAQETLRRLSCYVLVSGRCFRQPT